MKDLRSLDRKKLEALIAQSPLDTVADLERVRAAYLQSDRYKKNRTSLFIKPLTLGLKTEELRNMSKEEIALYDIITMLKYELTGDFEDKILALKQDFIFEATVFPPPIDLYISEPDAIRIFGPTQSQLRLHRDLGLLNTKVQEQQIHYIWTELKELFS